MGNRQEVHRFIEIYSIEKGLLAHHICIGCTIRTSPHRVSATFIVNGKLFLNAPFIRNIGRHGSTVVSTAASQLQGPGFDFRLGSLSVWSLHILLVSAWVSSGCSGFLPQSKDVRVRSIGHGKIAP